jgi:PAS domain S-box-containing protein
LLIRANLYAMLSRTNQAICRSHTPQQLYREVCQLAVDTGYFSFVWVGMPDEDRIKAVASAGQDNGYMQELLISLDPRDARAHGPTARCLHTGETFIVNDFLASPLTAPWHAAAHRAGFAASAALPLRARGKVVAVLTLYASTAQFFSSELVAALGELSPGLSLALDRFELDRERQRDEAALRLRDRAIQAVTQGICITNPNAPDHPIVYASPSFAKMSGYAQHELIGQNCRILQGPQTDSSAVAALRLAIDQRSDCTVELLNYRKDGSPYWNNVSISPVLDACGCVTHFVGIQTDVTERRRLEELYRQSQKMEAIGKLAGGIAHDFNNLLTVINGYAHQLQKSPLPDPRVQRSLAEIEKAGERAATLTAQLLAFSRQQIATPQVTEPNRLVAELDSMLRRLLGENVTLRSQLPRGVWPVKVDRGQFDQVLMNLVVNARDAMPDGGCLTIETHNVRVLREIADAHDIIPRGEYVVLSVADSGGGMDEEIRARIFEPYFTTKDIGKGTGLGLSMVHGIVNQWQGHITVESAPRKGSKFKIYIPRATEASSSHVSAPETAVRSGHETILLAEDEDAVRALLTEMLEADGYHVLAARNGAEALELANTYPRPIRLLISDAVMPVIGGRLLAETLRATQPACEVLFISGYLDDALRAGGVAGSSHAFLAKPFSADVFVKTVRAVLDGEAQAHVC